MCCDSPFKKICGFIIDLYRKNKPAISLEAILSSDINTDNETFFSMGWILATVTEHIFADSPSNINDCSVSILANLKVDKCLTTILSQTNTKYKQLDNDLAAMLKQFIV